MKLYYFAVGPSATHTWVFDPTDPGAVVRAHAAALKHETDVHKIRVWPDIPPGFAHLCKRIVGVPGPKSVFLHHRDWGKHETELPVSEFNEGIRSELKRQ